MTLRTRILLAFFYLVFLILVTAVVAAAGAYRMAGRFSGILEATHRQVTEAQNALASATENSQAVARTALTSATQNLEQGLATLDSTTMNYGIQLGLLVLVALLSLTVLSFALQRKVLERLGRLTRTTEQILQGKRHLRADVQGGDDELTVLAEQINEALDQQHALEAQMRGRLGAQRLYVLGLLRVLGPGAAVVGWDGRVVATQSDDVPEETLRSVGEHLVGRDPQPGQRENLETGDGLKFTAFPLEATPGQAVGWLVEIQQTS